MSILTVQRKISLVLICIVSVLVSIIIYLIINTVIQNSDLNNTSLLLKTVKNDKNPLLHANETNESWDSRNLIAGNCFLSNESKEYILLYYATSSETNKQHVGIARSDDGISFAKESAPFLNPGQEGAWDDGGVGVFPNCITQKADGTYMLYYTGHKEGSDIYHTGAVGLAISKDLKEWEKYDMNPILQPSNEGFDTYAVFEPSVIYSGNPYGAPKSYQMWYGGSNPDLRFSIGYAESIDGVNWEKSENNPVLSFSEASSDFDAYSIEVHSVTQMNNKYYMFYEAVKEQFPSRFSIGLAESSDGIYWAKSTYNPILEGGGLGEWDSMGAYHPSLVIKDNKYLLYYVGLNYKYDHKIGVSELNPKIFGGID